ncbi:MAG: Cof-type HAD-IIB family hydrolase [Firmicutes bacterium]|nr:HAD family phosphatase [Alicyclobacillaceae bacterium]MCL6497170.1 Cof-type HAD-IIB family hydrolase [Bacillota bacterium]
MEPIRLIACDLDGTLLDPEANPRPASAARLRELAREGVLVALATGRSWRTALKIQQEIGIRGPIIAHNGAYLFDTAHEKDLYRRAVALGQARRMLAWADDMGIMLRCYLGFQHPVYFNRFTEAHRKHWLRPEDREVPGLHRVLPLGPLEMFLFGTYEVDLFIERWGLRGPGYELSVFQHGEAREVNVCAPLVDKVEALAALCRHWHIAPDEVLAIGDGSNDVRMLRWAKASVAVGGGSPLAQAAARYVTHNPDLEPVEEALRWAERTYRFAARPLRAVGEPAWALGGE